MPRERDTLVLGRVVGDVVDPFIRKASLKVIYESREVINVCEMRPSQVVNPPVIEILGHHNPATPITYYTIVMVDPDCPSPGNPTEREYLHWLVTNVPAGPGGIIFGDEVVEYEGPQPWMGIHRYVFVVFCQEMGWQKFEPPSFRQNFITREFAHINNLGVPIAAVYFTAQRETNSRARRT